MSNLPLSQRMEKLFEEGCAACGMANSVGGDGFEASSDADGPTAGYDPVMGNKVRRRKKKRTGVNEGKKPLPDFKMMLKAGNLETRDEKDKSKAFRNVERARKIRAAMK